MCSAISPSTLFSLIFVFALSSCCHRCCCCCCYSLLGLCCYILKICFVALFFFFDIPSCLHYGWAAFGGRARGYSMVSSLGHLDFSRLGILVTAVREQREEGGGILHLCFFTSSDYHNPILLFLILVSKVSIYLDWDNGDWFYLGTRG
ncbi:hypothetical protein QBC36DRAFT_53131 [Triangularia setosa]|uniref:Secreted protein n=1 Tax=Triangularia setosa TaxID=2587417 RepID=A0AAN6W1I5_9PEZI|nr:hypothetical protein QBC36DRAFT_53131 [Podospora setosa]